MGRGGFNLPNRGMPMPVVPTENKGIVSGPIRKPRRQGRRMRQRGSRPDVQLGRVIQPDGSTLITYGSSPRRRGRRPSFENLPPEQQKEITARRNEQMERRRRRAVGRRMPPPPRKREPDFISGPKEPRPLTGGYDPESGVRYTDTGVPTAVEQTRRVPVQDPTLGGPPEREVPIPRERLRRITRESDPRGAAPFSPDEKGMARDRFFERMFDRADEAKQQRSMEREDMRETRRAVRDEREARRSDPGEIDIDAERGGRRRRRRGRRRDFTRRRSQMEGGRRGRSGREMAEFRDRYVSTLR